MTSFDHTIVSRDPGCVNGTTTSVNGYYVSAGTCQNRTVYLEHFNSTSSTINTYMLFHGSITLTDNENSSPLPTYAFYPCENLDYSSLSIKISNTDCSAQTTPSLLLSQCSNTPILYCSEYDDSSYASSWDYGTSDSLPTFFDYCRQYGWRSYDIDDTDDTIKSLYFYPNAKCPKPQATLEPFEPSITEYDPNELSEELTDLWAVFGIIVGIILVILGLAALLKRARNVYMMRRANRPQTLEIIDSGGMGRIGRINSVSTSKQTSPQGNDRNDREQIGDFEEDEDDIDEELGAVIVAGRVQNNHKTSQFANKIKNFARNRANGIKMSNLSDSLSNLKQIGSNLVNDRKSKSDTDLRNNNTVRSNHVNNHHLPNEAPPPLPGKDKSPALTQKRVNNTMLRESMITDDNNNNNHTIGRAVSVNDDREQMIKTVGNGMNETNGMNGTGPEKDIGESGASLQAMQSISLSSDDIGNDVGGTYHSQKQKLKDEESDPE